jgi:hypothetical protein
MDKMEKIDLFDEFQEQLKNEFTDFYASPNLLQKLSRLVCWDKPDDFFYPIGCNKSGSLIAAWRTNSDGDFNQSPIVWLSSEGFPTSVFANDFKEFLSLLPYGTGGIYDILCTYYFYQKSPKFSLEPHKKYSASKFRTFVKENKKEFKMHDKYCRWLDEDMKIKTVDNPLLLIENAIKSQPDLNDWLTKLAK